MQRHAGRAGPEGSGAVRGDGAGPGRPGLGLVPTMGPARCTDQTSPFGPGAVSAAIFIDAVYVKVRDGEVANAAGHDLRRNDRLLTSPIPNKRTVGASYWAERARPDAGRRLTTIDSAGSREAAALAIGGLARDPSPKQY